MSTKEAFNRLVEEYQNSIYSMAYQYTGDHGLAEDLAQEVFLKAYKKLKSFRQDAKISTWLYRIAVNTCIDWSRKKKLKIASESALEHLTSDVNVEDHYLQNEKNKQIQEVVSQLPEIYKTVIILYHFEQLSYREISQIIDLPEKTIETRLYRGRKKIKELLMGSNYGGEYCVR